MTKTNIEYFNSTLSLFIKDMIKIYPKYSDSLNDYYKDLLEKENNNNDKYQKIRKPAPWNVFHLLLINKSSISKNPSPRSATSTSTSSSRMSHAEKQKLIQQ